jgi:hypothetical protein
MTADSDTSKMRHEGTDFKGKRPFEECTDVELAEALQQQKEATQAAIDDVCRALLEDDVPLTDEKVAAVCDAAERLRQLWNALVLRVPPEYQFDRGE